MSFRKEKKYRVCINEYNKFQNQLLSEGMKELYTKRTINSIYFDTSSFQMFFDSEEGALPRKKIRLRWYDNTEKLTLEQKYSSIEGRYKSSKPCKNLCLSDLHSKTLFDPFYGRVLPCLKISYIRSYFSFKSMRITFDDNITYQKINNGFSRIYHDPERVIEVKTPIACSDDYLEERIPNPTSRFSKYSRGTLLSTGQLSEF